MISPTRPRNIYEAKAIQKTLSANVTIVPLRKNPQYIAGVDAAFTGQKVIGAACLYEYPVLRQREDAFAVSAVPFPYVPGFLSFREGTVIMEALRKLHIKPDVVLFDGQGIAHPKRLGIASHIGVLLGIPAIGCAKSRLIGEYEEPGSKRGKWSPLMYEGSVVGAVLRTRDRIKPVFVSPGHLITLEESIEIVLGCLSAYRIPEPLRRADVLSKKMKRETDG